VRARNIDLVVAFSQSRNTTMLAWSSGAPTRVGFSEARMEALLTHRVPNEGPPTMKRISTWLVLWAATLLSTIIAAASYLACYSSKADALLDELGIEGPLSWRRAKRACGAASGMAGRALGACAGRFTRRACRLFWSKPRDN
jgi:hypothetical protein